MYSKTLNRMTDRRIWGKGQCDETDGESKDQSSDYYYDDATGYRVYKDDPEDDNDEEDQSEAD